MKRTLSIAAMAGATCLGLGLLLSAQGSTDSVLLYWLRGWPGFGYNAQHTALSPNASQPINNIHWQTPLDLQQSGGGIHYGPPLVTPRNNVIVTVKTTLNGSFRIDCRKGSTGAVLWTQTTDYVLPPQTWTPPCASTLTPNLSLATPAIGGTVLLRYSADIASSGVVRQAFYGIANYNAAPSTYNTVVKINTPITSDSRGNLYFGFLVTGPNPAGLLSGLARMNPNGVGTWISAGAACNDATMSQVSMNCAPAISLDGQVVYAAFHDTSEVGYLVGMNSTTLAPLYKVRLKDPSSGQDAWIADYSTASPAIGPDGEVYYGVLENPFPANNDRGWMLHFNSTLTTTLIPGAFGWDNTASPFPSSAVPQYTGTSTYLLLTKYNNYAGIGGDGVNKIAVLDPHTSQIDPITGATIMKEILLKISPTPDPPNQTPSTPNAVREWCLNSGAVDVATNSALVNNSDGKLYRWHFPTNSLSQVKTLTAGVLEAYTPTAIGADGTVYAINDAILFAVGQ
ncbi:MAG TPA: hypothetical protein VK843_15320 [Planctomycetota bacterium]|nr:hypothetical protein [Planctomycetota bacterium]